MNSYARIDNGVVVEIIAPMTDSEGKEIPVAERFTVQFVATLVDISTVSPVPQEGWTYNGSTFTEVD